ncbi:MAG TPA: hypothetical protein VG106_13135 [Vicinamibacterales bacterium]|nr:hypothetical protein [Vicinamibacterales bacterium]
MKDLWGIRATSMRVVVAFAIVLPRISSAQQQQLSDPGFDASVANPAYRFGAGPRVLFDEAHFNFHTANGRYKALADLLTNDGYRISPNRERFSPQVLGSYDLLVIANALGAANMTDPAAASAAFTTDEVESVSEWVRGGGALLFVTDHQPTGAAARNLASQFGVGMSNATTVDTTAGNHLDGYFESILEFTRANGRLRDHPIVDGRDSTERVNRVVAFGGQSLAGPPSSTCFLELGPAAFDLQMPSRQRTPAGGRCMGLAIRHGRGRVVVMGEAGMLSAQLVTETAPNGKTTHPWGMNWPGLDNRQLALNIVRWLSGALK